MKASELVLMAGKSGVYLYLKDGGLSYKAEQGALSPELKADILSKRAEIIEFLKTRERSSAGDAQSIKPVDRSRTTLPLSYSQKRLWLLDQLEGGSAHYNGSTALKLRGRVDYRVLNAVFTSILQRHESLRTCFAVGSNGEPYQVIQPVMEWVVPVEDLSGMSAEAGRSRVAERCREEASRKFDLSQDIMLRVNLLKVSEAEHIAIATLHHIASDGWSLKILIDEFCTLYRAYVNGTDTPLPPLPIQYADYAHHQREWLQGAVLEKKLEYWKGRLSGMPAVHNFPLDRQRPDAQSFAGDIHKAHIDAETTKRLGELCKTQGCTLFMGLHAAFSVLLSRYSNETDIVVGSPVANRERPEIAGLIGFFVNTLVLRCDLSNDPGFADLLKQTRTTLMEAYERQDLPFELLVEHLKPHRSTSYSPLFQIMLVMQNNESLEVELPHLSMSLMEEQGSTAKYDILLGVKESASGLELRWEYSTDLFDTQTIQRVARHFSRLLKAMIQSPEVSVFALPMLEAEEREQLVSVWGKGVQAKPAEECIHHLLERRMEAFSSEVAVEFEDRKLTYGELNQRANQLARYLISAKHVKPDSLIGICLDRSLEMVIAILGILKAGGAYVPFDPDYPIARLTYMLEDSSPVCIVTQKDLLSRLPLNGHDAICMDDADVLRQLDEQSVENIDDHLEDMAPQNLAFVIYTSGSTGKPKGVAQTHLTMTNLIKGQSDQTGRVDRLRTLQFATLNFDASIHEMVTCWYTGSTLVVMNKAEKRELHLLPEYMRSHGIERTFMPPAVFNILAENALDRNVEIKSLKEVLCAGEALVITDKIRMFLEKNPGCDVWNYYGPTETHVATVHKVRSTTVKFPPVGKVIPGLECYVLNSRLMPVPVNVGGELFVGGAGLARGYLNRPELTAEKFVGNPFHDDRSPDSSRLLYRTGDLVSWSRGGDLYFHGRMDQQVKIRGFRVELGEIENTLRTLDFIKDSAVLVHQSRGDDKFLVAYVVMKVPADNVAGTVESEVLFERMRQRIGEHLPDYMMPASFVQVDEIPLTNNGKVDHRILRAKEIPSASRSHIAPRNQTEKSLSEIWKDVLGVPEVGVKDNFFQLGGHSLSVTRLVSRINQTFSIALPLKVPFKEQTLEQLANEIDSRKAAAEVLLAGDKPLTLDEIELTI
jgi:amino acid adenylation domain-containing protein